MPLFSRIHPISVTPSITIYPILEQNGSKATYTYKAHIRKYPHSPLIKCPTAPPPPPPTSNKLSLGYEIIQTETITLSNEYEKNSQSTMHEVRQG